MSDVLETPGQLQYQLYLESEHWARLRADAIALAGGRCSGCGRTNRLQVHHIRYRNPWESCTVEDVKVLCRPCHAEVHGIPVDGKEKISESGKIYPDMKALARARSAQEIGRAEFEQQRERIRKFQRLPKRPSKKARKAFHLKKIRLGWSF